jgi:RNA polymerase sigma factor (sigma-70 family)
MNKVKEGQKELRDLARRVADGDEFAFEELSNGGAKYLLINLANHFAQMHSKFEFDDFYSICLEGLYTACKSFNSDGKDNPCFLSYARIIILRSCWREVEYWQYEMRDIFNTEEVPIENKDTDNDKYNFDHVTDLRSNIVLEDEYESSETRQEIIEIINRAFKKEKAEIMKMYIIDDMRTSDIAIKQGIHYKKAYSTIVRGLEKIQKEYSALHLDKDKAL